MFDFNCYRRSAESAETMVQGQSQKIGSKNYYYFCFVLVSFMAKLCPFGVISLGIISNFASFGCFELKTDDCANENLLWIKISIRAHDSSIISFIIHFSQSQFLNGALWRSAPVVENSFAVEIKPFINRNRNTLLSYTHWRMRSNEEYA